MEGGLQFQGNELPAFSNLHDGRDGSAFRCFDPDQRKIAHWPPKGQLHDSSPKVRHPDESVEERLESDGSLGRCGDDLLGATNQPESQSSP
jgi:hypothetical protein